MPAVFVHGNPEHVAIWDELFAHLARNDIVALSPPGFGAPVPPRAGARSVVLQGRGHWWMCEDPALGARVLDEFFASLT
jgi:hypothetical protein